MALTIFYLGLWNKQPAAKVLQVSSLHLGLWQHETEANSRTLRPVPCKDGSSSDGYTSVHKNVRKYMEDDDDDGDDY